jgi:hypothetical protein
LALLVLALLVLALLVQVLRTATLTAGIDSARARALAFTKLRNAAACRNYDRMSRPDFLAGSRT